MADMAKRQSQWVEVNVALENLGEASTIVLGAAASLERRLVGVLSKSVTEAGGGLVAEMAPLPLLKDVESRIRNALGRVREAIDILHGIEKGIT